MIKKILTNNLTKIPMFFCSFNFQHYKSKGKENSCKIHLSPLFKNDTYVIETMNSLVDYIRDNYDMKDLIP